MKIENQVCTWEQGLALHQFGVIKNESFFQWMECIISDDDGKAWAVFRPNTGEYDWVAVTSIHPDVDGEEFETARECSAFTMAEVSAMLGEGWEYTIKLNKYTTTENQTEVMAQYLLSGLESGQILTADANKRLTK